MLPVLSGLLSHGTSFGLSNRHHRVHFCASLTLLSPPGTEPPHTQAPNILRESHCSSQATLSGKPCRLDVPPMSSPKLCLPSAVVLYQVPGHIPHLKAKAGLWAPATWSTASSSNPGSKRMSVRTSLPPDGSPQIYCRHVSSLPIKISPK